jgi:hypothetical protein
VVQVRLHLTLCNNNIPAGAYNFVVTDANGCTANASGLVNDVSGPVVAITSQTNVTCFGLLNGGASATIAGGVPNYTISWSGTQATANTTTLTSNFGAGIHNITVTDAAGCVGTASVDISQPATFVSAIGSFTNVSCFGLSDGGATILVMVELLRIFILGLHQFKQTQYLQMFQLIHILEILLMQMDVWLLLQLLFRSHKL